MPPNFKDNNNTSENPVVDFSAHLYPQEIYDEHHSCPPIVGSLTDPAELTDFYNKTVVNSIVLSQPFFMGSSDIDATVRANDALLDIIQAFDQFYGLAALPVGAGGEAAADEFGRCLDNGYNGGAITTKAGEVTLTDSEIEPVLELASSVEAPLLVHPKLDESLHPEVLRTHRLNGIFGREVALASSICRVIHEGMLQAYPDLNLVYHHSGGNIACMMDRIRIQLDQGRWPYGDTRVYDDQEALTYFPEFKKILENRIYIDTAGYANSHITIQAALSEFPPTQIVLGTDAPIETRTSEEVNEMIEAISERTSSSELDKIAGENAFDLLVNC
jgi:predicted TIM-barrel fold metal-dependent hydrolase